MRQGGEVHGKTLGVLGVYFDWEEQARVIVKDEPPLAPDEWERSRVLLLDNKLRVIASSDEQGLLTEFPLHGDGKMKGYYFDDNGHLVAFARTIGYQEYDGLGWYGVVIQKPKS